MIPTESYKGVTRSGSKPPGGGPIQNSAGDPATNLFERWVSICTSAFSDFCLFCSAPSC